MTRKHFKVIAKIISNAKSRPFSNHPAGKQAIKHFENELTDFCSNQNDYFNYGKFEEACKEVKKGEYKNG